MKRPLINILTRTHRKECFIKCEESISSQSYKNYRHILCIDEDSSLEYINSTDYIQVKRVEKKNFTHFSYNLYFNEMYKEIKDGWIMFLDDDDSFYSPSALEDLATSIEEVSNTDALILWKVWAPGTETTIPSQNNFSKKPALGHITGQGFCFHYSHINKAQWDDERASDFRVINRLYNNMSHIEWIDKIFTSFQGEPGSLAP